jgi:hypothetical protein
MRQELHTLPAFRLNARHLEDLMRSGITPATAAHEHIMSAPAWFVYQVLGWYAGSGMCFQFADGFVRFKLDRPMADGKRYCQKRHSVSQLYIPRLLDPSVLTDPTRPLWLPEGEKKAIKLCQEGFDAVAVTGVHGWLKNKRPVPSFSKIVWEGREVIIVFDSDPGERSRGQVQSARQWLAAVLTTWGANVKGIDLPDDGTTKVGADDFLVGNEPDAFRMLPRIFIPLHSSTINKNGEEAKAWVSGRIERLIASILGEKSNFDFGVGFRSPLNHGGKRTELTTFVKFRGETRVRVGKSPYPWPLAVVYFNALRQAAQPKGRYKMVKIPGSWMPIWQGLMEVAAGDAVVPDEYRVDVPPCAPPLAQTLLTQWATTLWIRHKQYPGQPGFFAPEPFALLLKAPIKDVVAAWEWLERYGFVEVSGAHSAKTQFYRLGADPIQDPEAVEREARQAVDAWLGKEEQL